MFGSASDNTEGRGDLTMASISLQDLRRRLYDEDGHDLREADTRGRGDVVLVIARSGASASSAST